MRTPRLPGLGSRRTARRRAASREPTASAVPTGRPEPLRPADPERVAGWLLLARLGAGAGGVVYLARSGRGHPAALKVAHPPPGAQAAEVGRRFAAEARAGRTLAGAAASAARFAAVLDADTDGPRPWVATAFVPGPTLRRAVAAHGPWPSAAVRRLGAELAGTLATVHRAGLVHRDVKPSNVLVAADGPYLIDFGVALLPDAPTPAGTSPPTAERVTEPGRLVGSPGFLAPELADGAPAGPAADVFALAALLAYAATGENPYGAGTAEELLFRARHEAPRLDAVPDADLRATLSRCLYPAAEWRPSPRELRDALGAAPPAGGAAGEAFAAALPAPVLADIAQRALRDAALPDPLRAPASEGSAHEAGRRPLLARRALLLAGGALTVAGATAASYAAGRATRGAEPTADAGAPGPTPSTAPPRAPGAPPEALWVTTATRLMPQPVVAAGALILPSTQDSPLRAVDVTDGSDLWTLPWHFRTSPVPTPDGAHLLVIGFSGPTWDRVGIISTDTGRFRTSAPFEEATTRLLEHSLLAMEDHTVFLLVNDRGSLPPDTQWTVEEMDAALDRPWTLLAYDLDADEVRWRRTFEPPEVEPGPSVVVAGRLVLLEDDTVRAYRTRDGEPAWEHALGTELVRDGEDLVGRTLVRTPDDGVLICGHGLLHLDATTGEERWSADPGNNREVAELSEAHGPGPLFAAPPGVLRGTAFLNAAGRQVWALDTETHRVRWVWEAAAEFVPPPVSVQVGGGWVFPQPSEEAPSVRALDAETGAEAWELSAFGVSREAIVAADDERFYVHQNETVRAFPLDD